MQGKAGNIFALVIPYFLIWLHDRKACKVGIDLEIEMGDWRFEIGISKHGPFFHFSIGFLFFFKLGLAGNRTPDSFPIPWFGSCLVCSYPAPSHLKSYL
jgi:hypothetical protein